MPNFAVIDSNKVMNVIVADTKEIAKTVTGKLCVDISDTLFRIGDVWNGTELIKIEDAENLIEGEIVPPAIED